MTFSYHKWWELLIDKNINKSALRDAIGKHRLLLRDQAKMKM
jgi:DNA-binding Xre family transcriptional regulator